MTIIDMTAPAAPTTLHVRSVPGLPASVRIVTAPTSTLVIGAAPWRHARRLASLPIFAGPCVYILTGEEARIGKTTGLDARFRDHRRTMPMPRIDEIVAIACPAFTSDTITTLEASLTTTARRAGVVPVLGAPLKAPILDPVRDRDVAHWLREIPALLLGAGCTLLDPEFAPPIELRRERAAATGSGAVREGWQEDFPEGLTGHPATMHFALERGGLQARAAVNGPWTVLRAGSRAFPARLRPAFYPALPAGSQRGIAARGNRTGTAMSRHCLSTCAVSGQDLARRKEKGGWPRRDTGHGTARTIIVSVASNSELIRRFSSRRRLNISNLIVITHSEKNIRSSNLTKTTTQYFNREDFLFAELRRQAMEPAGMRQPRRRDHRSARAVPRGAPSTEPRHD